MVWGINTLFLIGAGLTVFEVFVANASFAIGMVLFEVPTGAVADVRGRRFSFLLGVLTVLVTSVGYLLGYVFTLGIVYFVIFSVLLGLGFTFYSGALEAWAVDQIIACGEEGRLKDVFATGGAIMAAATLIGTFSGGLIADVDLALTYVVRSALLFALFVWALFTMKEPRREAAATGSWAGAIVNTAKESIEYGWKRSEVRSIVLISLFQGTVGMWAWYAWQPYLLELLGDSEAYWVAGAISVGTSSMMLLGSRVSSWWGGVAKSPRIRFTAPLAVSVICVFLLGFLSSFWPSLIALMGMMFTMGLYGPVKQTYMHAFIPSAKRATVISFDSLVGSIGGSVGQPALGAISQGYGFAAGYMVGAAVMVPTLLLVPGRRAESKRSNEVTLPSHSEFPATGGCGPGQRPEVQPRAHHEEQRPG